MSSVPIAITALRNQWPRVRERRRLVQDLLTAIAAPESLSRDQALHWYAIALEFKPDLIIELGRGAGNSTAVFTDVANALGARVKSFDLAPGWSRRGAIAPLIPPDWFSVLELLHGDLTQTDFAIHVETAERILVLWDAHGYEVADAVLGGLLPLIATRPNLVLCHDISDNRAGHVSRAYEGPFWRGMNDYYGAVQSEPRSRLNIGWINSIVDQVLPIMDFCWRNQIELHSADQELAAHPHHEIRPPVDWAYFTLNEAQPPFHFPPRARVRAPHAAELELQAIKRSTSWRITAPLRAVRRLLT